MTSKVFAATNVGFEGKLIEVECDTSNGLPGVLIVGLGNKAIEEAKERVRSAIKNTSLEFPRKRITINLAPANLPKDGAHFDLAIAISLLAVSGQIPQEALGSTLIIGELALDGSLRPVRGALHFAETARLNNLETLVVPAANAQQASLIQGVKVLPANNLREVFLHFTKQQLLNEYPFSIRRSNNTSAPIYNITGQDQAKRALTIAAAGGHNILLSGPPGAGKTMLARAALSLLPPLSDQETIEVTKLHSLTGLNYETIITERPFRSPHHSASHVALIGGGQSPKPGEISLSHRGVLFLDELPEYSRQTLEALRQPLEDRVVHIARANEHVTFPADFILIATQNPCPCGYLGDPKISCQCSNAHIQMYQRKISGPLLDRIDIVLTVSRIKPNELLAKKIDKQKIDYSRLVNQARQRQHERYGTLDLLNTHLQSSSVKKMALIHPDALSLLNQAADTLHVSARSYFKIIKIARTIADLENSSSIEPTHITEALQYRPHLLVPS